MTEPPRGMCIARSAFVLAFVAAAGCTAKKDAAEARASVYDADFAVVYSAVVDAVRALYPNFEDDPGQGIVKTAWHQVKYSDPGADDPKSVQSRDRTTGVGSSSPSSSMGYSPSMARRLNFIRFDVSVAGGRPWAVRVRAAASQLEPGNALPTELRGANAPHWLAGRADALTVEIHRRLKRYARKAPQVEVEVEAPERAVNAVGGEIPEAARVAATAALAALNERDYRALRAIVADDVVWFQGAPPGVEDALVMWQADPAVLAEMSAALSSGCAAADADVVCPSKPAPGARIARFAVRAGSWRLVSFVAAE